MTKVSKLLTIVILIFIVAIASIVGFELGKKSNELIDPLNINQWDVKEFSIQDNIVYQANDHYSYITDNQKEGWNRLLSAINIVCKPRYSTSGSTTHTKYKIEMKNGDIYYIEWLGCLDQVDITYPDGTTKLYYGYYR